jgi:hypothetical protein
MCTRFKSRAVSRTIGSVSALLAVVVSAPAALSQGPVSVSREFVFETAGLGVANAIIELQDGGFAAVGYADDDGETGTDVFFVRFDAAGDTLWTRSYGAEREEFGWDVVETEDGGFLIVGYVEAPAAGREDVLVLRVDALGAPIWERTFGEAGRDRAWSGTLAENGDLVIAGEAEQPGQRHRDAYLIRIADDGETRWTLRVDKPGDQRVYHIARTEDDAFVVTGTTGADTRANRDVYVVRVDRDGNAVWSRTYGEEPDDVGHGVLALDDGDVLVTGYGGTLSNGGTDVYLLRIDTDGNLRWWQHDGEQGSERAMMSARRADGGYVSVGFTMPSAPGDVIILESDPEGAIQSRTALERPGSDRGVMITTSDRGGYVLAGTLGGSGGSTGDFAVLWLAPDTPE